MGSNDELKRKDSNSSKDSDDTVELTHDQKYGYGSCTPDFIQCGNNAKGFLTCFCFFVVVQGLNLVINYKKI